VSLLDVREGVDEYCVLLRLYRKLVFVPYETFHKLAEIVGDPQIEVNLVDMTTRCGSTLISQVR